MAYESLKKESPPLPKALPGFEGINRYWDPHRCAFSAKILPGEYYISTNDEVILTVLGSCVSACIRDTVFNVGGMNHFMLPMDDTGKWADNDNASARYGNFAMEQLINGILKNGGSRKNLEVKLVGGGKILSSMTDVGKRNIEFVLEYIKKEGFMLTSQDLGDVYPRKVVYYPRTGKMLVKKLRSLHNDTILQRESSYRHDIVRKPVEGEIELF